jgi:acetolactate synthase-1/2/3 large subunit
LPQLPPLVPGKLDTQSIAAVVARHIPENAIVMDESITGSQPAQTLSLGSAPHDYLQICGGSIGNGLPLAVGAALGAPDRKVICLEGDGSAMYTIQALWTMAREKLDVVTVMYANRSYAILNFEFDRVGGGAQGPKARSMLDIGDPTLDFVSLARGMGVNAARATTTEELDALLAVMCREPGPHLIEAVMT